ncbi:hypothetical protein C0995_007049, partial [Termitomyces sp. Mi166
NNDNEGDNDNEGNNDSNAAMDIDTGSLVVDTKILELLHFEETQQGMLTEAKMIALVPVASKTK